jgi:DNA-binding LytR/AlgR family response regulator
VLVIVGDRRCRRAGALQHRPDVLFFDIRMPGQGGLEAAAELAEEWPQDQPFPALVFVTAYDQYALQAFESQAIDYVLKPVQPARLQKTVEKLRNCWRSARRRWRAGPGRHARAAACTCWRFGRPPAGQPLLKVIQASVGTSIRMVPVEEVLYFEAADKYVRVLDAQHEYLIRTPLRELLPQLDAQAFWQVHRGTVVRATPSRSCCATRRASCICSCAGARRSCR